MTVNNKTAAFCRRDANGEIIMVVDTHHRKAYKFEKDGQICPWSDPDAIKTTIDWNDIKSFQDWEEMI